MPNTDRNASELIDRCIEELGDWRGRTMAELRKHVHTAVPDITEEWKWGTPVWSRKGLVCSAGAFKEHVKLNFFKGAFLEDPDALFNAGLDAKSTRSIDIREGEKIKATPLKRLIKAAAALNEAAGRRS